MLRKSGAQPGCRRGEILSDKSEVGPAILPAHGEAVEARFAGASGTERAE